MGKKKKKTNFQKWLAYMKKYPPEKGTVPAPSKNDSGKVLGVGEDGKPAWVPAPGGGGALPDVTREDIGKVLTVNDDAKPAWGLERPWVMDPMAK